VPRQSAANANGTPNLPEKMDIRVRETLDLLHAEMRTPYANPVARCERRRFCTRHCNETRELDGSKAAVGVSDYHAINHSYGCQTAPRLFTKNNGRAF
jgi:hypothetical protein